MLRKPGKKDNQVTHTQSSLRDNDLRPDRCLHGWRASGAVVLIS